MAQHNTWGRDRAVLSEAYESMGNTDPELEDLARDAERPDPQEDPRQVEDAENPEIFQLIASVGELDAVSMEEFLYGLAQIFDDPDVTDHAFELTRSHISDAYDAFKDRSSN